MEYQKVKNLCLMIEDQVETSDYFHGLVKQAFPDVDFLVKKNCRETLEWLKQREIDLNRQPLTLALIDLGLPDGNGIELLNKLSEQEPTCQTIVLSIYDDDADLFEAISAGASGYILKEEEPTFLVELLKRINQGEPPLSPAIAKRLLEHFRLPVPVAAKKNSELELTPRERETLTFLARGLTVAETAQALSLSPQTVAGYVKVIYQKLHVSNRVEATREAIRRGLI